MSQRYTANRIQDYSTHQAQTTCSHSTTAEVHPAKDNVMTLTTDSVLHEDPKQNAILHLAFDEYVQASMSSTARECILDYRSDIAGYLRSLTPEPERLLKVMLLTDTIIAGSRAAGFFVPGLANRDSDWDFFCCGTPLQRRTFLEFMIGSGFTTNGCNCDSPPYPRRFRVLSGTLTNGSGRHSVQLISDSSRSEVAVVSCFHSSILWCYISGSDAVSIEPGVSAERTSVICHLSKHDNHSRVKYRDRGVTYVRPSKYYRLNAMIKKSYGLLTLRAYNWSSDRTSRRIFTNLYGDLCVESDFLRSTYAESWVEPIAEWRRRRSQRIRISEVASEDDTEFTVYKRQSREHRVYNNLIPALAGPYSDTPVWSEAYGEVSRIFECRGLVLAKPGCDGAKDGFVFPENPVYGCSCSHLVAWVMAEKGWKEHVRWSKSDFTSPAVIERIRELGL